MGKSFNKNPPPSLLLPTGVYSIPAIVITVNICSTEGSRGHVLVGMFNYRNQCLPPLSCEMEPCSWRGVLDTLYDQVSQ